MCRARVRGDDRRGARGAAGLAAEERQESRGRDRSALVIGGTEKIRTCGAVVFCKVVAVAGRTSQGRRSRPRAARWSRDAGAARGQGRAGCHGPDRGAGSLGARFVKGERERLLARAFMIRVIVLMTLMPDARPGDVIAALAGDLALVPWARPWRPASGRAAGDWRRARPGSPGRAAGPGAGIGLAGARRPGLPGCGDHREEETAEGGIAGRDAGPGAGHAREQGVLRHRGHGR